jgi:hypothetical protein
MSTESGIESTGAVAWGGLPEVIGIVTRVFCTGALIQLLTECDATTQLLRTTDAHQPGALRELFSQLTRNTYYDQLVTWLAFSYTSAYVAMLDDLMAKKTSGGPEDVAAQARGAALKDVVTRREELRKPYFNDDDPGVLFAGADKLVKDRFKAKITKGMGIPPVGITRDNLVDLNDRLQAATWLTIADAKWLSMCGNTYRVLRIRVSDQDLGVDRKAVLEVEALLDPNLSRRRLRTAASS